MHDLFAALQSLQSSLAMPTPAWESVLSTVPTEPDLVWEKLEYRPIQLSERHAQGRRSPKATNVVPRPRSILSFLGRAVRRTRTRF